MRITQSGPPLPLRRQAFGGQANPLLQRRRGRSHARIARSPIVKLRLLQHTRLLTHMKISDPAVTSDVYQLVKTIEFDLEMGDKFLPTRVEVFRDTQRKRHFRCHMWELEYYHMESTFSDAADKQSGKTSDEPMLVERTWELSSKFHDFEAANAEAALKKFLSVLRKHLTPAQEK